jgi:hypothetical protein
MLARSVPELDPLIGPVRRSLSRAVEHRSGGRAWICAANAAGDMSPNDECGLTSLSSLHQALQAWRASSRLSNHLEFKHSSRSLALIAIRSASFGRTPSFAISASRRAVCGRSHPEGFKWRSKDTVDRMSLRGSGGARRIGGLRTGDAEADEAPSFGAPARDFGKRGIDCEGSRSRVRARVPRGRLAPTRRS